MFVLFFSLLYFESVMISGVKFAIIWKAPVILFIILRILKGYKPLPNTKYLRYGYLYNFKMLFSLSGLSGLLSTVNSMLRFVVFPLLLHYFHLFFNEKKAIRFLRTISIFILLSTIPFIFNFIEPLKSGYDLEKYGIDGHGFIGVFQKPHSASMTLSIALIITIFFLKFEKKKLTKSVIIILVGFGVIALIQTYVRTGLAMLLVGLAIIYLEKKNLFYYIKLASTIIVIGIGAYFYAQNNEALQMRFQEKNIYQNQSSDIDLKSFGSGRFMIAFYALENWVAEGLFSIFFGLGEDLAREKMIRNKGSAIFAHNGLIESLQKEGLIGFFIFVIFLFNIYKTIKKHRGSSFYKLNLAIFLMFIAGVFLQGNDNFFIYSLVALALTLLKNTKNYNNNLLASE